jgi:hypothetical protein
MAGKEGVGKMQTRAPVMEYLAKHPDEVVWLSDVLSATGLIRAQVQNAMTGLIRDGKPVEVIQRGQAWRWNGDAGGETGTPRGLEYLAAGKDGAIIIKDSAGHVYRAVEI